MKTFASVVLLASLVFISAEARPSEDDAIVEFAIGESDLYAMQRLGEIMEKYGRKLALIGRVISRFGDSITGFGRWLKNRNNPAENQENPRTAMNYMVERLTLSQDSAEPSEAYIAMKILAIACQRTLQDTTVTDEQVVNFLGDALSAISQRMIEVSHGADVDAAEVAQLSAKLIQRIADNA